MLDRGGRNPIVTDSICLPSASSIHNTLYLYEILSFICLRLRQRKRKRSGNEAVSKKDKRLNTQKTHEVFY